MKTTGITSLAIVATAAAFISTADAHGGMTFPTNRTITAKYRKDGAVPNNVTDQQLQYSPIELLNQRKPESAAFTVMNGCRGTVYEEGISPVTTLAPGAEFDVKWFIQVPHLGYMNVSIVKPDESSGTIMYKNYKTILNVEPFGSTGGDGSTTAKMPTNVEGCDGPGKCALQFFWFSNVVNQTYPTCADIIVSAPTAKL